MYIINNNIFIHTGSMKQKAPKEETKTLVDLVRESHPQVYKHIHSVETERNSLRKVAQELSEEIQRKNKIIDKLLE